MQQLFQDYVINGRTNTWYFTEMIRNELAWFVQNLKKAPYFLP